MQRNCPLCNSEKVTEFFQDEGKAFGQPYKVKYFLCSVCELVHQCPSSLLPSNEEKKRYEEHNNSLEDERYIKYMQTIWNFSFEVLPERTVEILDFGCGPNSAVVHLANKMNINAEKYDPYFFNHASVLDKKYDFIFCIEVAEHFYNPQKEFALLRTLLKKKGQLILRTGMLEHLEDFPGWWYHKDPTHVIFFREKTIQYICQQFDFSTFQCQENMIRLRVD